MKKENKTEEKVMAKSTAEVKNDVKEVAKEVTEKVKEVTAEKANEVKKAATEKANEVKKVATEKAKDVKKTATAKVKQVKTSTAAKKVEATTEVYIQFYGQEAVVEDITKRVKEAYISEGHKASAIKSLKVYIKPEEAAAYYVVNEKNAGRIDLF